jgi:hypothetical protein
MIDKKKGILMRKILAFVVLSFLLSGCATGIQLSKYAPQDQPKDDFTFCHGYSCTYKQQTGFSKQEWNSVAAVFKPAAKTPEAERSKIAKAIARMETIIGKKTNTGQDTGEALSIKQNKYQMDCLDETVNTSRYLAFLYEAGLFKFHQYSAPVHRGYFIDGEWPHNTATIQEIKTGRQFVVDSFYRPNGQEPYILPREVWLKGWKPSTPTL